MFLLCCLVPGVPQALVFYAVVVYSKEVDMCAVLSLITVPALEQVRRDGC